MKRRAAVAVLLGTVLVAPVTVVSATSAPATFSTAAVSTAKATAPGAKVSGRVKSYTATRAKLSGKATIRPKQKAAWYPVGSKVRIQRLTKGTYRTVKTVKVRTGGAWSASVARPATGKATYRAKLVATKRHKSAKVVVRVAHKLGCSKAELSKARSKWGPLLGAGESIVLVEGCGSKVALVQYAYESGSTWSYAVLLPNGATWRLAAATGVGFSTPVSEPLFTTKALRSAGLSQAALNALPKKTKSGRPVRSA